ncbi:MAG: hypothetical protein ABIN80_00850 [Dyadobacter sp.]|uniref:hypothetical protein n=1 Tax=Dyadobacter sp. TaxID=1914288 RepID=UPI00326655B8
MIEGTHTEMIEIAINDANVFIDLCEIGLVEVFFGLPLRFHTTQLVLSELEEDQYLAISKFIKSKTLIVRDLTRHEIDQLSEISIQSRKLSMEDLSVYYYARELESKGQICMILTGDNRLKKEAVRQGFEAHGVLWVFEQLVSKGLITSEMAINKLQELMRINTWLPTTDCERMMAGWER